MKTEKRLTMALSVLVALMMLAVPLASSSNLFVDGGQTNSNGDAPALGAEATGYTITFKLNADGKSLDQVDLDSILSTLRTTASETWFIDENGDLCAHVTADTNIQALINDLYDEGTSLINKGDVSSDDAPDYAYSLNSWKTSDGKTYTYVEDNSTTATIKSNMTFSAEWTLNDGFVEIPVKVTFDGETKDYVKAYKYLDEEETKVNVDASYFNESEVYEIMGVNVTGIFVNNGSNGVINPNEVLYTFTAKDSSGKDLKTENDDAVTISVANNSIILDYTLKSIYSKITVKSIIFEEDVTLYANVGISYSYNDVFLALQNVTINDENIFNPAETFNDDGSVLVNGNQYKATTWNGSELLYSTNNAGADLTLDATLNSYKVVFMVNGQYEVVDIPFGELSADKCTLDVTGINRWVTTSDYSKFETFNFTDEEIKTIEGAAVQSGYVPKVFVAVFTPSSSTAYAVFDANESGSTTTANFGNELVTKIVVPGKDGESISKLSLTPELEGKNLFMGWKGLVDYDKANVKTVNADWEPYMSSITFNGDNSVNGVLYFSLNAIPDDVETLFDQFVAASYNDKLYSGDGLDSLSQIQAFVNAIKNILCGSKDGYHIDEWKDADGNAIIKNVDKLKQLLSENITESNFEAWLNECMTVLQDSISFKDLKGDVNFYANFVPEDYLIIYYANTATASNTMVQVGTVDEGLALFGESTFGNEGYILKEWNTRPDGKGTSYALGSDFTLNGTQYKDAANVPVVTGIPSGYDKCVTLYAIWEKVGGSDVPGGNTGGDDGNDNTALYLIAGMLAVIAVLAIVGIVLMRKK